MVDIEPLAAESEQQAKVPQHLWHHGQSDESLAKALIEKHVRYTGSKRGAEILGQWGDYRSRFVKVFPKEYRPALGELAAAHKKAAAEWARSPDFSSTSGSRGRTRAPKAAGSIT